MKNLNLMHIAICRLLEPYSFYEFDFYDDERWPHIGKRRVASKAADNLFNEELL
jgi:hypothetical protein